MGAGEDQLHRLPRDGLLTCLSVCLFPPITICKHSLIWADMPWGKIVYWCWIHVASPEEAEDGSLDYPSLVQPAVRNWTRVALQSGGTGLLGLRDTTCWCVKSVVYRYAWSLIGCMLSYFYVICLALRIFLFKYQNVYIYKECFSKSRKISLTNIDHSRASNCIQWKEPG